MAAVKIATPPTIDGAVDEGLEWKDIPSVAGLFDNNTGQACPETGRFWLAYDDKYIYFAAKLIDSRPGDIHATERRTNVGLSGDDFVALEIDVTGSLAEFNTFAINPRGATNITLAGGRAAKREWSGEFQAQARITAEGWEAEARIPWQVMRLPGKGKRDVRFNVSRSIVRLQRQFSHVYTGSGNSALTPRWLSVELPGQSNRPTLKLLPYGYLGYDPKSHDKGIFNAGLDLKTPITDQVELVGSVNPDFRNIENQILSLDFSRFERLAGETRPFFQEGAGYLGSQIYASQRIPNFDAGINTYGKLGDKTNFGFLDASDFGVRNNMVATVTHSPDAVSSFRGSFTSLDTPGLTNEAYLIRYLRSYGPTSVFLRNMGSKDSNLGQGMYSDMNLNFFQKGLNLSATYAHASPEFIPRLGFVPETNFKGVDASVDYNKPWETGPWNDAGLSIFYTDHDFANGGKFRREFYTGAFATLRGGLAFGASTSQQRFLGQDDNLNNVFLSFPRGNPYRRIALSFDWGQQAGSPYQSGTVATAYRFGDRLQLGAAFQAVRFLGTYADQAIVSFNYDLGHDLFLSGRTVKRGGDVGSYIALRQSGNKGTEYFLIFGDPNSQRFRGSLILKVTMPFEIKL